MMKAAFHHGRYGARAGKPSRSPFARMALVSERVYRSDNRGDVQPSPARQWLRQWTRGAVEIQRSPQSSFSSDQST